MALGCSALLVATFVALFAFLVVGHRMARAIGAQVADPVLQRARTQEILPAPGLPSGWEARLGVSVPLFGRIALYERPGATLGDDGLFFYLERQGAARPADPWTDLARLLEIRGLELQRGELMADGTVSVGPVWLAHRAARAVLVRRPTGERAVLVAWLEVHCPDPRVSSRLAVWIEPDPFAGQEIQNLSGTPADPRAVGAFAAAFDFCG